MNIATGWRFTCRTRSGFRRHSELNMRQGKATVLVLGSPRGGTGKTAVAACVAGWLARSGHRVLLVDLARSHPARQYLACTVAAATTQAVAPIRSFGEEARPVAPNLWLAEFDGARPSAPRLLAPLLNRAASLDAWVVVDPPSHIDVRRDLAVEPDIELLVLRADASALANLERLLDRPEVEVVLNQIDMGLAVSRDVERMLTALLGERLLARVPCDRALGEASGRQTNPFDAVPLGGAAEALATLADLLAARVEQRARANAARAV
jgi:hypothetical protein